MGRTSQDHEKLLEWVKKCKENNNDEEAFGYIVKALHAFLMHLSNRKFYRIPGHGSDDIYQEGLYALSTKAIPDYQEDKGAFLSFAKLCIRRHVITVLKSANNGKNRVLNGSISLDATARDDKDEGPIPVSGIIPCQSEHILDMLMRKETHKNLKAMLLQRLTPLEAKVVKCYLKGMSYQEIVATMNRGRKKKNRANAKQIDNSICRSKSKSCILLQELNEESQKNEKEKYLS